MSGRNRKNHLTFVQIVLSAAFVYCLIYLWTLTECLGFSQCSLCQKFTPVSFLNKSQVNSSADDFFRLMNLNNFTFLMNNPACNEADVLLLVLVHSHPCNVNKRLTIRKTWGRSLGDDFKLLFLLGRPKSGAIQQRLDEENDANGDLVQGNFADTYRNLTYKHVMGLKWTKYFCSRAKYVLKTDDDVFINSPGFLLYLKRYTPKWNLMLCLPIYNGWAKRSSRSKWRVTISEYKFTHYPTYCQGMGVLYSADVVSTLYANAQRSKYFWVDDVFVTGILASASNIKPSSFGNFILNHERFHKLLKEDSKDFPYLLGSWNLQEEDIKNLWERVLNAGLLEQQKIQFIN